MGKKRKEVNPNKPCANCEKPLGNRFSTAKYCLRKDCRNEVSRKWNDIWRAKKRKERENKV